MHLLKLPSQDTEHFQATGRTYSLMSELNEGASHPTLTIGFNSYS